MSQKLIDQITLDCLINKEFMGKHIMKQREKQINKEDLKFYRKRIFNLFRDIITNNQSSDLSPDVKYAYDSFVKTSIDYFKVVDNNDLLQEEYNDIKDEENILNKLDEEITIEQINYSDANNLMMRLVKMDVPTLDKYVKKTKYKKDEKIFLPKSREVDITNPELKNKGLKKNITNIYEDTNEKNNDKKET
jgi:hypothetical protein